MNLLGTGHLRTPQRIAIACGLAVLLTLLFAWPAVRLLVRDQEYRLMDYGFVLRGPVDARGSGVWLVLVDDDSLEPYGFNSPTPRALLANVIRALAAKGVRCIGLDFTLDRPHLAAQDADLQAAIAGSPVPVVLLNTVLPRYRTERTAVGFAEVITDGGNRARAIELRVADGTPAFAAALYSACTGAAPPALEQPALLNFQGPPSRTTDARSTFPAISARHVAGYPAPALRGKIVLVGSGKAELGDVFLTPFSTAQSGYRPSFGVELHATLLAMLVEGRELRPLGNGMLLPLVALLFLGIAGTALAGGVRTTLPAGMALTAGWVALAALLFIRADRVLPVLLPLVLGAVGFVACQMVLYLTESRQTRFLTATFSRYLSPQVLDAVLAGRVSVNLGGEMRHMTILFSDLAGFTNVAERLDPREVVALLNQYLSAMVDAVFAEEGTIGSFMGDGILAYFGAPNPQPDHAVRACRAALRMQAALEQLNAGWRDRPWGAQHMRIGIHSGDVVIGNIGSQQRTEFTLTGDAVNLASRLEGVNKLFGSRVIVSDVTLRQTGGRFATRELCRVIVKGRSEPVGIHELLEPPGNGGGAPPQPDYAAGLAAFYGGRLAEGESCFTAVARSDPAAAFMADRCRELLGGALPSGWNGAIALTSK